MPCDLCENSVLCVLIKPLGRRVREEDIEKLFSPFQQLDSGMSKKYQGVGLGLTLARRIVEFHDGKVGVKSIFGKGSTFSVVLPRISKKQ